MHPWVQERKGKNRIAVQMFPLPEDSDPTGALLAAGVRADELGFDGFFIGDHPGYAPDAWMHLAALASATKRIQLGSIVNCVMYRHPAVLARQSADLTLLSAGRFMLGLGIGWNVDEFAQLGIPFPDVPDRQAALEEAIAILRGMWTAEPFDLEGRFWVTRGSRIQHPPSLPPIAIAGAGDRTLGQVARLADISNFGSGRNVGRVVDDSGIEERLAFLAAKCAEVGRPYDDLLHSHFTTWLMLAPNEEAARAKLDRYYPNGMNEDQTRTRIWGTPAMAVNYFQRLIACGLEYFVVQILDARDLETLELLASEVAPHLARADT